MKRLLLKILVYRDSDAISRRNPLKGHRSSDHHTCIMAHLITPDTYNKQQAPTAVQPTQANRTDKHPPRTGKHQQTNTRPEQANTHQP